LKKVVKATIIDIIVAFIITGLLFVGIYFLYGQKVSMAFSLANMISINANEQVTEITPEIDKDSKKMKKYPKYGTQYATIEIPAIDVNLPVYVGESLELLKKGVGHSTGSYFPGEGGSIVYMGHNYSKFFRRFGELEVGDEITIKATYGTYKYKIYDLQLIKETEVDKVPIQDKQEILMVYTCYPFNNIGYATQRYVVYAEPIEE